MDTPIATQIKAFLQEGRTSDALALLLAASQPNEQVHGAIQLLLAEFNDLTSNRLRGAIDDTESAKKTNSIHDKILIALSAFDSEGKPLPGSTAYVSGQTSKLLVKAGLMAMAASILLVLVGMGLKLMSNHAASNFVAAGYILGLGALFVLVVSMILPLFKGR